MQKACVVRVTPNTSLSELPDLHGKELVEHKHGVWLAQLGDMIAIILPMGNGSHLVAEITANQFCGAADQFREAKAARAATSA